MFDVFPGYNATPMTELAMQLPMYSFGTPYVPDFNDDGALDLWHHNHYTFTKDERRWSDPSTEMKGPKKTPGGCMVDWDAVFRDGSDGSYYPPNGGDGFIEWTDLDTEKRCFDTHSTAFLDFDGDGIKDLFLVTGGGRGVGKSWIFNNIIFWGEATDSELGFRLVGGRDAAEAAGLDGREGLVNERGRHQYWFDVDGDGLLDVLFLNYERKDDLVRPGQLYHNMGGRKFKKVEPQQTGFVEFATMAMLTDVDGDGFARETVVPSECNMRKKPSDPPQNAICERSPHGSTSIYSRDATHLLVRESITPSPWSNGAYVKSLASGDFDFDGLADIAILWGRKVTFHLSSKRKERCQGIPDDKKRRKCFLTLGEPDVRFALTNCGGAGAVGMRFADYNLDGSLDMLVVCKLPGLHSIYEMMNDGTWREMQSDEGKTTDLGKLNSPDMMLGGKDFCEGVPIADAKPTNQACDKVFSEEECKTVDYNKQFIICNIRAQSPEKPGATALGATVADIDNDGFVDIIVSYRFGSSLMFRNTIADTSRNRFLAVRLDRTAGAAASIGAIVKLTATHMGPNGSADETTTQMRVVSTLSHETDGDGGSEDRLIFGLGRRGQITELSVHWPHCCNPTVIDANKKKFKKRFLKRMDNMLKPFEVPLPENCDVSCLKA